MHIFDRDAYACMFSCYTFYNYIAIGFAQELYPDPPPAYEEYYNKTSDNGPCNNETTQQPIQEQPHAITVQ